MENSSETQSASRRIPAGRPHRTLRDVVVHVRDYDSLSGRVLTLPAGSVFQPWEPLDHWRGERVPITLGDGAAEFDWGVTSFEGHFLAWDDFFSACEPVGPPAVGPAGETRPALSGRCWRTPDGLFLLEGAESTWPVSSPSSVRLPGGAEIERAPAWYVVSPEGLVTATYSAPRAYSLEDVLYVYDIHVLEGGRLCEYVWQQQWGYEEKVELTRAVLTGLVECARHELPFDPARVRLR